MATFTTSAISRPGPKRLVSSWSSTGMNDAVTNTVSHSAQRRRSIRPTPSVVNTAA